MENIDQIASAKYQINATKLISLQPVTERGQVANVGMKIGDGQNAQTIHHVFGAEKDHINVL
jgi:hypothetical protein